jgi:hypothetical protein
VELIDEFHIPTALSPMRESRAGMCFNLKIVGSATAWCTSVRGNDQDVTGTPGDTDTAAESVQTFRHFFVYVLGCCISELGSTSRNTLICVGG